MDYDYIICVLLRTPVPGQYYHRLASACLNRALPDSTDNGTALDQCATKEEVGKLVESENATGNEIKELVDTVNELRLEMRSVKETTDKQTEEHTKLTEVIKEVDRVTADERRELAGTLKELRSEIRNITNKQTEEHTKLTEAIREADNATGDEIRELAGTLKELRSEIRNIKEMLDTQMEEHNELKKPLPRKGSYPNPAISCSDLLQDSPSGEYWIQTNNTNSPVQVYCDMTRTNCNTTGGWTRVANLDMTDSSQQCPDGFRLVTRTTAPLRTCGRLGPAGCVSTTFPVHGIEYSQVCGRIRGYHENTPEAFFSYIGYPVSIDDSYVNGVSLTHGDLSRQHIWTFAAAGVRLFRILDIFVRVLDQVLRTLEQYHHMLVTIISVRQGKEDGINTYFILMIHSRMVRDVGVPVLAAPSKIHRGSVNNSHSQLQTILS